MKSSKRQQAYRDDEYKDPDDEIYGYLNDHYQDDEDSSIGVVLDPEETR